MINSWLLDTKTEVSLYVIRSVHIMGMELVKDIEKQISKSILRTIFVAVFAVAIKVVQLVVFDDAATGLLKRSSISTVIGIIVILCICYVVFEYIMLTLKLKRLAGYVNITTQPLIGLSLVMVGICFLFQGITDILTGLTTSGGTFLMSIINVLTIVSAVDYGIQGFEIISEKRRQHFILNMVPVVWSIAVLMNVVMTCPTVVSMQSNAEKVICCSLLALFMYYTARWACGYEQNFMSHVGVFFRVSFSVLTIILVFPYCISYLFGAKDSMYNMPYIAMFGLAIYGFLVLLQYMALSLTKIQRKNR